MRQPAEAPPDRFFLSRLVKGRPFSADVEIRRRPGGGNQQPENGKIYVDSTGRLRQELVLDKPGASIRDSMAVRQEESRYVVRPPAIRAQLPTLSTLLFQQGVRQDQGKRPHGYPTEGRNYESQH